MIGISIITICISHNWTVDNMYIILSHVFSLKLTGCLKIKNCEIIELIRLWNHVLPLAKIINNKWMLPNYPTSTIYQEMDYEKSYSLGDYTENMTSEITEV